MKKMGFTLTGILLLCMLLVMVAGNNEGGPARRIRDVHKQHLFVLPNDLKPRSFGAPTKQAPYDLFTILNTRANAVIHLNCSNVQLKAGDTLEVITDRAKHTYISPFDDVSSNAIIVKYITRSGGNGRFSCTASARSRNMRFKKIDSSCLCGGRHPELSQWSDEPTVWEFEAGSVSQLTGTEIDFNPESMKYGGSRRKRMVGGKATNKYDWPAAALLLNTSTYYCGATVISKQMAVTSAFCLQGRTAQTPNFILVGDHDLNKVDDVSTTRLLNISKMIMHPEYDGKFTHNIGVVKFNTGIKFHHDPLNSAMTVQPACLPIAKLGRIYGKNLTLVGWGRQEATIKSDGIMQRINLDAIPLEICREVYEDDFKDFDGDIRHLLCLRRAGRNAQPCGIDSGGPIFYAHPHSPHIFLMGIIGDGGTCTNKLPTIHTNVTYHLGWLASVMNDEEQPVCVR